ncbi:MAG TPA: SDR family oxidoreductase [Vicinamibacterales bacterium]|nr:SDR family oxidoreductase [Vicinamibacterales bacterium]
MRLRDKVAVVTGGGSGFGAAICRRFVEEGAKVVVVDCRRDGGEAIARETGAIFVEADVASEADARRMIATAVERFGRLDILVNNAGAPQAPTPVTDIDERDFDRLMAVNAKAIALAAKHAVPILRRQGGGVILNTVSVAAIRPRPNLAAYNASKGAALVLSKSLAIELAPDRIRVNAVCPGPGDTPMLATFVGGESEAHRAAFLQSIPLGRLCAPGDVAGTMVFLASDEASFITGAVIEVDGGRCI